MIKIDQYREALIQYYKSSDRPYSEVGNPLLAYSGLLPETILEPGNRLILYGPPGSGKTTFLDWIATYSANSTTWIPIFVPLRNYGSTIEDLLRVSINKFMEDIQLEDLISDSSTKVQPVFLFDGLDEVPTPFKEEIQNSILQIANYYSHASIVVTSRNKPELASWKNWKLTIIPRLTPEQIQSNLIDTKNGLIMWNKISKSSQLMELASRPAFLHSIINAFSQGSDFRDYLMREIPAYTVWRGHTKSKLSAQISPKLIDKVLMSIALDTAIRDTHDFPKVRLKIEINNVLSDEKNALDFLDAVLATDIFNSIDDENYFFAHKSLLESYAARKLLEIFRSSHPIDIPLQSVLQSRYASEIVKYFITILRKEEFNSLGNRINNPQLYATVSRLGRDEIADRLLEVTNKLNSKSLQVLNASTLANKFLESQARTRKDILVIAIPGFNTRGDWMDRLGLILTQATDGERYLYRSWDYGDFRSGILSPFARRGKVNQFHVFYNNLVNGFPIRPEICIVAHSFGTYILAHAFRRFPELNFDRILFLGSALPCRFRWPDPNSRIGKMLNLIGSSDTALWFARLIPGLGRAGKKGFLNDHDWLVQEKEDFSDHSDLFGDEYMRLFWLPFIREGSTPDESRKKNYKNG